MGIGKRIGDLCAERGINLRKLAINADVPYTTLYSAVKRDSDGMDTETLKKIADALGVVPAALYGWQIDTATTQEITQEADSVESSHYEDSKLYNDEEINPDAIEGYFQILLSFGYAVRYIDGNFQIRKSKWIGNRFERSSEIFILSDDEMKELIKKQLSYAKFNLQEVLENAHYFCVPKENSTTKAPPAPAEAAPTPSEGKGQDGGENA